MCSDVCSALLLSALLVVCAPDRAQMPSREARSTAATAEAADSRAASDGASAAQATHPPLRRWQTMWSQRKRSAKDRSLAPRQRGEQRI